MVVLRPRPALQCTVRGEVISADKVRPRSGVGCTIDAVAVVGVLADEAQGHLHVLQGWREVVHNRDAEEGLLGQLPPHTHRRTRTTAHSAQ